ncbi:MAG: biotin--[acetyl-CoA-carboxylase] ligase [Acidimicrobiia bacterium]|nr:biotin--[acetyl-CoA-carboxylase] ligase [Acidimicrobiia bacterium]MYB24938.1 biotin--[acetyl-CoA-carboxylase] ligase [Acidimicrobiia bacterium]
MSADALAAGLAGTVFGPVRFVGETGSTNADLMAEARAGAPEGLVLVADHQTAGRGRHGRAWVAPPGTALLASALLRPPLEGDVLALLSPATALAVRDACAAAGVNAQLKWPNDVIAALPDGPDEAKLAGVLAELHTGHGDSTAVVVGFGVNLTAESALREAVAAASAPARESGFAPLPPVALDTLAARPVSRHELLISALRCLDAAYRRLLAPGGPAELLAELRRHSATLGRRVRILTPGGAITGTAEDLGADGALVVATADGRVAVAAGDCRHLRAEPA